MTKHGMAIQRLGEELRTADARIVELEARLKEAEARADIWERNYAASGDKDLASIIAQKDKNWADYSAAIEEVERLKETEARLCGQIDDAVARLVTAEADAGRFKLALEQVGKWTKFYMPLADGSSWEETLREVASYTEVALSPAEQADDEKGVKG